MIYFVILIVLVVLIFFIKRRLYKIPYNNTILITGAPGTGKTTNAVDLGIKLWKKQRKLIKKQNKKQKWLPKKWRLYQDLPQLYSNIPIRIGRLKRKEYLARYNELVKKYEETEKIVIAFGITPLFKYLDFKMQARSNENIIVFKRHKFCPRLEIGHLLNQKRLPPLSTCVVTEIGKIAHQYSWGNVNVQNHLNDFISMYRQYTLGGYFVCDDQATDDIVKQIRVRIGTVINLIDFFKIWKIYVVSARRFHISEDIKTIEDKFAENSTKKVIGLFPLFFKKFDTYCFSGRYATVPEEDANTFYGYKTNEILVMPNKTLPTYLTITDDH